MKSLNEQKKITTTGLLLPELRVGAYGSVFGGVFSPLNPTSEINAALVWEISTGRLIRKSELKQYDLKISLMENNYEEMKFDINEEVVNSRAKIITIKEQMEIASEGSKFATKALQQCFAKQQLGTVRPMESLQAQKIFSQTIYLRLLPIIKRSMLIMWLLEMICDIYFSKF